MEILQQGPTGSHMNDSKNKVTAATPNLSCVWVYTSECSHKSKGSIGTIDAKNTIFMIPQKPE